MKSLFTAALCSISLMGAAQQEPQQPSDDQLQQQPPRDTQRSIERGARIEAVKQQGKSEMEAEQAAKAKGQSQIQTKTQPVGINPPDTLAKPRDVRKQDLSRPKKIMSEDSKRRN